MRRAVELREQIGQRRLTFTSLGVGDRAIVAVELLEVGVVAGQARATRRCPFRGSGAARCRRCPRRRRCRRVRLPAGAARSRRVRRRHPPAPPVVRRVRAAAPAVPPPVPEVPAPAVPVPRGARTELPAVPVPRRRRPRPRRRCPRRPAPAAPDRARGAGARARGAGCACGAGARARGATACPCRAVRPARARIVAARWNAGPRANRADTRTEVRVRWSLMSVLPFESFRDVRAGAVRVSGSPTFPAPQVLA